MTPQTTTRPGANYSKNVDPPVAADSADRSIWSRLPRPGDIVSGVALITGFLVVLGWRYTPPSRAVEIEATARAIADSAEASARVKADTELRADINRNTKRIDDLNVQQRLTNFLLCEARRGAQNDPRAREKCDDIIAKWVQQP